MNNLLIPYNSSSSSVVSFQGYHCLFMSIRSKNRFKYFEKAWENFEGWIFAFLLKKMSSKVIKSLIYMKRLLFQYPHTEFLKIQRSVFNGIEKT